MSIKNNSVYEDMSNAEIKVADFLKSLGIIWSYEQPIYVLDDKGRPRVWTPDFYLPEIGIYVEVCGVERASYEFRKQIYSENSIPIVFVHAYKEEEKWKDYLIEEIKKIHDTRWNIIKEFS